MYINKFKNLKKQVLDQLIPFRSIRGSSIAFHFIKVSRLSSKLNLTSALQYLYGKVKYSSNK